MVAEVSDTLPAWLEALGYADQESGLHFAAREVPRGHAYSNEIALLMDNDGAIRARAVFDVEGTPTVVFLEGTGGPLDGPALDAARKAIWNQNLVTIIVEVCGDQAKVLSAQKTQSPVSLDFSEARWDGPFSALDVATGAVSLRKPEWFDANERVDKSLLRNLSDAVDLVASQGLSSSLPVPDKRFAAQMLMAQVLFVSYLEHRGIVGETYRRRRSVVELHELVAKADADGVRQLLDRLHEDFNGDFLSDDRHEPWEDLSSKGYRVLNDFLKRTVLATGQGDLWNYDFSVIPIELLSGFYESFLQPAAKKKDGAFYTPRHLAALAVDQAFAGSSESLNQTVFDGACGSGILLTTTYRRLIALAEDQAGRPLKFGERREILRKQIYGADTNAAAGRVTAFSLYLSLLEGINPRDILEAQETHASELPSLAGINLVCGPMGDFFSTNHPFSGRRFGIVISNPPWEEPEGNVTTSADVWAEGAETTIDRRQIAAAFSERATEFVAEGGVICLILPIPLFLGSTSNRFVRKILTLVRPLVLINFGDLQGLLFPTGENTCHLFVGVSRSPQAIVPITETFWYSVPKADLSLTMGRLSFQSADRHKLATASVIESPERLVLYMWGDAHDQSIITRLSTRGRMKDLWARSPKDQEKLRSEKWVSRKGVHREDTSRVPVSAAPLKQYPLASTETLNHHVPVLRESKLTTWPDDWAEVAALDDDLLRVFDGPRVLFADGFSKAEKSPRAVYVGQKLAFTSSIGVIAGPAKDEKLVRLLAIYLRSSLAKYFMMMTSWKMLAERNAVHLTDVTSFPFFRPSESDSQALAALDNIASVSEFLEHLPEGERKHWYEENYDRLDDELFSYFGLTADEGALVRETVQLSLPAVRPRSMVGIRTFSSGMAELDDVRHYATSVARSLSTWRDRAGGTGQFSVDAAIAGNGTPGAAAVAKIDFDPDGTGLGHIKVSINDQLFAKTLDVLQQEGLSPLDMGGMQYLPTIHIWLGSSVYIVRSLLRRNWTLRMALRDADQLVERVRSKADLPNAQKLSVVQ